MDVHAEQPPKLEFNPKESEESLTAYLSAIGGAVIGLLLTLLVLAIWNGGTLNFTNNSRVEALEAGLTRVDENVGAVSRNVETVNRNVETVNRNVETLAQRTAALESATGAITQMQSSLEDLDSSLTTLDQALSDQGIRLDELDQAVADLDVTRRNFDTFTAALAQVLTEMGVMGGPAETGAGMEPAAPAAVTVEEPAAPSEATVEPAAAAETTVAEPAAEESAAPSEAVVAEQTPAAGEAAVETQAVATPEPAAEAPVTPLVMASSDVAADAVLVYLFVDGNGNGAMDADEASIVGATIALIPSGGEALTGETNDGGALFEGVEAGEYTVSVEDALGYTLATDATAAVTVTEDAESGQIVYFAVQTSAGE